MIKYYCQFSYGGYKVYRINGIAHEQLKRVTAGNEEDDIPTLADVYFNYGGAKIVYRYLDSNTLDLVICDIPGPEKDTDGRSISCAVQFIGNKSDREILDNLAIRIANNLKKFEDNFADMFDLWEGLHFEGDRLDAFVKQCANNNSYQTSIASRLLDICGRQGQVLLFVPFSDNYRYNEKVREKLSRDLQLPPVADNAVITFAELKRMQLLLNDSFDEEETKKKMNEIEKMIGLYHENREGFLDNNRMEQFVQNVEQMHKDLSAKKYECSQLRKTATEAYNKAKAFEQELTKRKGLEKKCLYAVGIVFFIMLLIIIIR